MPNQLCGCSYIEVSLKSPSYNLHLNTSHSKFSYKLLVIVPTSEWINSIFGVTLLLMLLTPHVLNGLIQGGLQNLSLSNILMLHYDSYTIPY